MKRWEEEVEAFDVQGSSGNTYQVRKMQTYTEVQTTTHTGRGRGSVRYILSTGESVQRETDEVFHILWLDREDNEAARRIS